MNTVWIDHEVSSNDPLIQALPSSIKFEFISSSFEEAVHLTPWESVDLLVMELRVPGHDTLSWVPKIRSKNETLPILLVTAHASKELCMQAINLGINGILEKPASPGALSAHLQRYLHKLEELKLDQNRKSVFSKNRWVDLTSTEYKILETLKMSEKRLTRSELQNHVWPNASISENNLDTHLTNLKRKIPELQQHLSVKRGLGYFLSLKK